MFISGRAGFGVGGAPSLSHSTGVGGFKNIQKISREMEKKKELEEKKKVSWGVIKLVYLIPTREEMVQNKMEVDGKSLWYSDDDYTRMKIEALDEVRESIKKNTN